MGGIARMALASVCVLALCGSPLAQERLELRGSGQRIADPSNPPLDRRATASTPQQQINAPIPQYRPFSPGALPEEDATGTGAPGAFEPSSTLGSEDAAENATTVATPAGAPPAEEELTTGTVRQGTIDSQDLERNIAAQRDSERAAAIEAGTRRAEDDPFAATGIRAGSFILRPTLQQGVEYTTNAAGTAGGGSDVLSETTVRLNAESDWSRHRAELDAFGTYRKSLRGTGFEEFTGGADATASFELGSEFLLNSRLGYSRGPEDASSPVGLPAAASRPLRQTINGELGLEKALGQLRFGLTGDVARNTYGNAALIGGGTLSQADRNQTLYTARLRAGYQVSPALRPFIEGEYGRRIYDQRLDQAGFARSANRYGARAGIAADLGEKLNGEISAGWITERLDDTRLGAVSAFTVDGNLEWSPLRGTTVSLNGSTEIEGSTRAGEPGSVLYASTLRATRALRADLTGSAALGAALRRYADTSDRDLTLSAEAELTYWLNRYAGVTGRARHERLDSTIAGRDSNSTSIYLGLTLQR